MLKETTGAFDVARTHDWQVSTYQEADALPTAPLRLNKLATLKTQPYEYKLHYKKRQHKQKKEVK